MRAVAALRTMNYSLPYTGYRGWNWGRGDYYCQGRESLSLWLRTMTENYLPWLSVHSDYIYQFDPAGNFVLPTISATNARQQGCNECYKECLCNVCYIFISLIFPQQVVGTVMAAGMTVAGERIKATTHSVLLLTGTGVAARVTAHSAVSAADLGNVLLPALLWLDLGYPHGIRENLALTADRFMVKNTK